VSFVGGWSIPVTADTDHARFLGFRVDFARNGAEDFPWGRVWWDGAEVNRKVPLERSPSSTWAIPHFGE